MSTPNELQAPIVTAQRVAEKARFDCLPNHFGDLMLVVETSIYEFLRSFAPGYRGAYSLLGDWT